jgi:hypothetical protein
MSKARKKTQVQSLFSKYPWSTEHLILCESSAEPSSALSPNNHSRNSVQGSATCHLCNATFEDYQEQRSHFQTNAHRINASRQLQHGISRFPEQETLQLDHSTSNEDACSDDDSPSESSPLQKPQQHSPWIMWQDSSTGLTYRAWKCIFTSDQAIFPQLQALSTEPIISTVILSSGGHFSAAVFQREQSIAHISFHRYISRRKQGGIQSVHDQSVGHNSRSAGANLRRYNEMALIKEIHAILDQWKSAYAIHQCRLFFHAPSHNMRVLQDYDKSMFTLAKNPLLSAIPITTQRPTFHEVQRVHQSLYSVSIDTS